MKGLETLAVPLAAEVEHLAEQERVLDELADQLASREAEFAALDADFGRFRESYLARFAPLYAELDRIEAEIERVVASRALEGKLAESARARADQAEARAHESASAAEQVASRQDQRFVPAQDLKAIYRLVAKAVHPDLATDDEERARRTRAMARASEAYAAGDEETLRRILDQERERPEAIIGDDIRAQLVRVLRKQTQIRTRFAELDDLAHSLGADPMFLLFEQCRSGWEAGGDPLAEDEHQLRAKIAFASSRLAALRVQGVDEAPGLHRARKPIGQSPRRARRRRARPGVDGSQSRDEVGAPPRGSGRALRHAYEARCGDPRQQGQFAAEAIWRVTRAPGPAGDAGRVIHTACRLRAAEGKHWSNLIWDVGVAHWGETWLALTDTYGEDEVGPLSIHFLATFGEELTRQLDAIRDGHRKPIEDDDSQVFEWVATLLRVSGLLESEFSGQPSHVMVGIAKSGPRWILYHSPNWFYLWDGQDPHLMGPLTKTDVDRIQERYLARRSGLLGRLTSAPPWGIDETRPRFDTHPGQGGDVFVMRGRARPRREAAGTKRR